MPEGEKPTRSESEGGSREAKITVLAAPESRDLTDPAMELEVGGRWRPGLPEQ